MKLIYGSQNFGYNIESSDNDWLQFVIPSWLEMLDKEFIFKEIKNPDGGITFVKDIRYIPNMLRRSNFTDLQFLYSIEHYNTEALSWFFENREAIVRWNEEQLFISNSGFINSCLRRKDKKELIRAKCYLEIIKSSLSDKPIVFRNELLRYYRLTDDLPFSEESIREEVAYISKQINPNNKNLDLMLEADNQIIKIIKSKIQ